MRDIPLNIYRGKPLRATDVPAGQGTAFDQTTNR
jgi:hypothetical protein